MVKQNVRKVMVAGSVVLTVLMLNGCIKQRPNQDLPGSGLANGDVLPKAKVLDVVESLKAVDKIQDATTRDYKLTIEDSAKDIFDDLGYVTYETDSQLLTNEPRFIGRPGAQYSLVRVLQGDRLLVYKVSDAKNISYIEKTNLVKKFDDGKIGVPFLSFPVTFYNIRYLTDSDNRKTNQRTEELIRDPARYDSATHISVSWNSRTVLTEQGVDKSSFFPKSFFKDADWYLSVFKTDSSDYQSGGNHFVFLQSEESQQFGIFRNVKFEEQDETTFAAISSALPKEVLSNKLSEVVVAPLKVKWIKLRLNSQISGSASEEIDNTGSFRDSEYFQIDYLKSFEGLKKTMVFRGGNEFDSVNKVSEVIVSKDLFSFIVENDTVKYRVNFMRKSRSDYKELANFYDDRITKLGIFNMGKPTYLLDNKLHVENDFYKYFRVVRFDPNKKNIVYYISEESPNNSVVNESAARAVKYINDSLRYVYKGSQEKPITVSLSPKRVRRGDPRYNILDYNSENNPNTYGGLGNPYFDEETGEVISANSFIYYGITKMLFESALTEYLSDLTGVTLGVDINGSVENGPGSQAQKFLNPSKDFGFIYLTKDYAEDLNSHLNFAKLGNYSQVISTGNQSLLKTCYGDECSDESEKNTFESLIRKSDISYKAKNKFDVYLESTVNSAGYVNNNQKDAHNVFQVNRRSGVKAFAKLCDMNQLKGIYKKHEGSSSYLEDQMVKTCVESVLTEAFVPTVVHEMLHNFGLDHNMQGSTDKANYLTAAQIKEVYGEDVGKNNPSQSNSIMDYFEYRTEDSPYPSTYDWAVLRYLYRNQVELSDGRMISLVKPKNEKLLGENVIELIGIHQFEERAKKLTKEYGYCLQAEIDWGTNPLCDTFDIGSTPLEIAQNYIQEYEYDLERSKAKGTRYQINNNRIIFMRKRTIDKLSQFYSQWRKELITLVGEGNKYLESFKSSSEFYDTFARKISTLSNLDRERVLEYYQIRNLIYGFLRDQVFMSPYTCVFNQSINGNATGPEFVDFDQIYRVLLANGEYNQLENIDGCSNIAVQKAAMQIMFGRVNAINPKIKPTQVKYNLLSAIGLPMKDYSYSLYKAKHLPGSGDISGFAVSKYMAAIALLGRQYTPFYNSDEYYFPSFLDEPEFRDNFEYLLKNRYLEGFWVGETGSDINAINLNTSLINDIFSKPEHSGFRFLMNSYGVNGPKEFLDRVKNKTLPKAFKGQDKELFNLIAYSPYIHNFAVQKAQEQVLNEQNRKEVFAQVFDKIFVNSYLSESSLIPIYASLFRSSLNVPNNLSVTKERTERFLMGASSNDYAYVEYMRDRYKYVADLGSFLVYAKNDEATFSRDLIIETQSLTSVGQGLLSDDVDTEKVTGFVDTVFDKYLNSFREIPISSENTLPTLQKYFELRQDIVEYTSKYLSSNKEWNKNTKIATGDLIDTITKVMMDPIYKIADTFPIEAYDRFGTKLKYSDATDEIIRLKQILSRRKDLDVSIPTLNSHSAAMEKNLNELIEVVAKFEKTVPISTVIPTVAGDSAGVPDLLYAPYISADDYRNIVDSVVQGALGQLYTYKYDSAEYDEKKELLSKFLFTLAVSR